MPQDHARTLREQKPLSRRARWLLGLGGAVIVVAVVVIVLIGNAPAAKRGCINTPIPGVIGAQNLVQCGSTARHTCATVKDRQREFGSVGVLLIEKACRKGSLPVS